MFCGTIDVYLANVFEIPSVTAVNFGSFVAIVAKRGSRLRTFAVVSILSHELLIKSTASCNFENVSSLNSTLVEIENKRLKVVKKQGTAQDLIGFMVSASIALLIRTCKMDGW